MLCIAFSGAGVELALRLRKALRLRPWRGAGELEILAPASLLARHQFQQDVKPYVRLRQSLADAWPQAGAIIFVGALGIAVRAIAPLLRHKSRDPAVVAADAGGRFAISLLSGHWGGGNDLANHVGGLLDCQPVVTTASDCGAGLALDLLLKGAGLRILDWRELPRLQALFMEGGKLAVSDPLGCLPPHPRLIGVAADRNPDLAVHWRAMDPKPGLLRSACPALHVGIGARKGVAAQLVAAIYADMLRSRHIYPEAIACLATVAEKAEEAAIRDLAWTRGLPLLSFPAEELAQIATPNPSPACAARFGQKPFSVCEAAALASVGQQGAALLFPKTAYAHCVTLAVAAALGGERHD